MKLPFIFVLLVASATAIPYLVSLRSNESLDAFRHFEIGYPLKDKVESMISHTFSIGKLAGFSGNFTDAMVARLKKCPLIASITPDVVFRTMDVQENAPRHLVRLSQTETISGTDNDYIFSGESQGQGVNVYVIDSGIQLNHPEFEGRTTFGIDFTREGSGDTNGHGTHVAGIIGSKTYGVAKNVGIVEIKALDISGAGSLSTIISALEFAVNHRLRNSVEGVVNLSLGAIKNNVLNQAIEAAIETGLVVVVAAGNSNIDACLTSPASANDAITVGAIDDYDDHIASFSNWGGCVDVFASGVHVVSVNAHSSSFPQVLTGTSMSAPVVAGLAANLLSDGVPPQDIKQAIVEMSSKSQIPKRSILFKGRSPNRIVYNGY